MKPRRPTPTRLRAMALRQRWRDEGAQAIVTTSEARRLAAAEGVTVTDGGGSLAALALRVTQAKKR